MKCRTHSFVLNASKDQVIARFSQSFSLLTDRLSGTIEVRPGEDGFLSQLPMRVMSLPSGQSCLMVTLAETSTASLEQIRDSLKKLNILTELN